MFPQNVDRQMEMISFTIFSTLVKNLTLIKIKQADFFHFSPYKYAFHNHFYKTLINIGFSFISILHLFLPSFWPYLGLYVLLLIYLIL